MDLRSLKKDVQRGTATVESLFGMLERMDRRLRKVEAENSRLRQRLGKYEPEVLTGDKVGETNETNEGDKDEAVNSLDYSLEAEERRRGESRQKPVRQGRVKTSVKWQQLTEPPVDLFPENVLPEECRPGSKRVVWRIDNGLAKQVGYQLHRGPNGELPQVPDVLPAGEFDVQIVTMLAYLTYIMRLSLDQVCELFGVFWKLPLFKSQADALLNQLSRELLPEFDRICELLAFATVAWTDDTGWKIAGTPSNATVIGNHELTLLMFGCEKGRAALQQILPPNVFRGVLVSDDHTTYQLATPMQKCWVHLLRKAIRLMLLYPEHPVYREFLDELLVIYREAHTRRPDETTPAADRQKLVDEFKERTRNVCWPHCFGRAQPPRNAHEKDHDLLAHEILRLTELDQLFTFLRHPEVPAHNNFSEQTLRGPAQCRKLDRTSKTQRGCRRRSVITSYLETLSKQGQKTLAAITHTLKQLLQTGRSLLADQLEKAQQSRQSSPRPSPT